MTKTNKPKGNKKMKSKPNYSLNKAIKSTNNSKKFPVYRLENHSLITIKLPIGMDMSLQSNEDGSYCSIGVSNFTGYGSHKVKGNFKTRYKEDNRITNKTIVDECVVKKNEICSNNYSEYCDPSTNVSKPSHFSFNLTEYKG